MIRSALFAALIAIVLAPGPAPLIAGDPKPEVMLKRALESGNLEHIAYYLQIVARPKTPAVLKTVLNVGERYSKDPVRTTVANILAWAKSESALAFFQKELSQTKSFRRAVLIIEALERIEDPATVPALASGLQRIKDARILTEIVRALRYKPHRESIDALVDFFKKVEQDQDKLWAETLVSLHALTGADYELYQDWANWWLVSREGWKPVSDQKAEEKAMTSVYRRRGSGPDLPQIFGQEIPSKRVVFVIDTSQSMGEEAEGPAEEGGGGQGKTRLQRAQHELVRAVQALRKDVKFGIVAYNTHISLLDNDELLVASAKNKKRALEFIRGWDAEGTTNTGAALLAALAIAEVDTIILLSDGSPTDPASGKLVPVDPILDGITEENRFKLVTIHTLGFPGAKVSFMKALAYRNHGTYAHIK